MFIRIRSAGIPSGPGLAGSARAPAINGRSIALGPAALARLDSSLLWPCSIRSIQQPLSSSRSIAYRMRARDLGSNRPSRQSSTRAGFTSSENGFVNSGRGSSGGRESIPGPQFWCHRDTRQQNGLAALVDRNVKALTSHEDDVAARSP